MASKFQSSKGHSRDDLGFDTAAENLGVQPVQATADLSPGSQATGQSVVATAGEHGTAKDLEIIGRGTKKLVLYRRRFLRNRMAVFGLAVFVLLVVFALFGGFMTSWAFDKPDFLNLSTPPSPEHYFGTTSSGHDLFAQTAHGLGRSLTIALTVSVMTSILSAVIGASAALIGGRFEKGILAIIHFLLAIPTFLLIALLVSDSKGDWKILVVVLIAFGWMFPARVIWAMALSVRENDYVQAARFMGVSTWTTVVRHIIPNIGSLLIIQFTLGVVSTVVSETALSFLGLGVKLPDVSLGTLLSVGANALNSSPWEFYFPATVLTLLTVSMALVADGLRDALDPNSQSGGRA